MVEILHIPSVLGMLQEPWGGSEWCGWGERHLGYFILPYFVFKVWLRLTSVLHKKAQLPVSQQREGANKEQNDENWTFQLLLDSKALQWQIKYVQVHIPGRLFCNVIAVFLGWVAENEWMAGVVSLTLLSAGFCPLSFISPFVLVAMYILSIPHLSISVLPLSFILDVSLHPCLSCFLAFLSCFQDDVQQLSICLSLWVPPI